MNENMRNWPEELVELLGQTELTVNKTGYSGDHVYHVKEYRGAPAFLKIAPSVWWRTLRPEIEALAWLDGKLPVPKVLYTAEHGGMDYLLMEALSGKDGSHEAIQGKPEFFVKLYAESLRRIHSLDIRDCPLANGLDKKLRDAKRLVDERMVDPAEIKEEYDCTPEELYRILLADKPGTDDPVFAHGDYCPPNLIIDGEKLSGFIDLGRAGVADRYQDIGLAIRSLRHDYGDDRYKALFLEHYGLTGLDEDKVEYYIRLDEFF
ncbi:aminoglycoside O-phosphotransferase APH(3')-IVa [Paenibacillus sp. UNC499MF]|uniref:aminoglycoside O-phosphotransferase APH(3')-IVa n=1 Tax=Paenibacillus sp. UNC499MF TaxID=1502751 RepID=UPI00089FF53B|nr:aminoglycoside O-phosphotransferase APH(3')-IVa [Paenibacillus sp. UNC499MF]SEG43478.1 kanamycin kinase [Paenibacillus sp. UNC499MF]